VKSPIAVNFSASPSVTTPTAATHPGQCGTRQQGKTLIRRGPTKDPFKMANENQNPNQGGQQNQQGGKEGQQGGGQQKPGQQSQQPGQGGQQDQGGQKGGQNPQR
jgi:hypothetical protein